MASDGENLTGLWIEGQMYFARTVEANAQEKDLSVFEETKRWLSIYFSGKVPDFTPNMNPKFSPFQSLVSACMRQIPYGKTVTYKDIARQIARQTGRARVSCQAVGGAVGHNPISILIPCHRVIGSNGNLTGYAGGLPIKKFLLTIEGIIIDGDFVR